MGRIAATPPPPPPGPVIIIPKHPFSASMADMVMGDTAVPTASSVLATPERAAGDSSFTPPPNHNGTQLDLEETPSAGGEDWLEGVLYIQWRPDAWDQVKAQLDEIKEELQAREDMTAEELEQDQAYRASQGLAPPEVFMFRGQTFAVRANGMRLGGGGKGPMFRYVLERDGIVLGLMNRADVHDTLPNAYVRVSGDTCLARGGIESFKKSMSWLRKMGARVVRNKVSRVDLCIDLPGVDVAEFVAKFREQHYVSRLVKWTEHGAETVAQTDTRTFGRGRRPTGFSIGSGSMLRIYDKLADAQKDLAVLGYMIEHRWGGSKPECATRVEFQLRREWLKDHGIDSVEDWERMRGTIAEYVTTSWFRMTEEAPDRRQTQRSVVWSMWTRVERAFAFVFGRPQGEMTPVPRASIEPKHLVAQAVGCMRAAISRIGIEYEHAQPFVDEMVATFRRAVGSDADGIYAAASVAMLRSPYVNTEGGAT